MSRERRRKRGTTLRLRGGAWNNNGNNCRSAYRNNNDPDNRNNNIGLRVVVSVALTLRGQNRCKGLHRAYRMSPDRAPAMRVTASEYKRGLGGLVGRKVRTSVQAHLILP